MRKVGGFRTKKNKNRGPPPLAPSLAQDHPRPGPPLVGPPSLTWSILGPEGTNPPVSPDGAVAVLKEVLLKWAGFSLYLCSSQTPGKSMSG